MKWYTKAWVALALALGMAALLNGLAHAGSGPNGGCGITPPPAASLPDGPATQPAQPLIQTEDLPWGTLEKAAEQAVTGNAYCGDLTVDAYQIIVNEDPDEFKGYVIFYRAQKFIALRVDHNGPAHIWFGELLNGEFQVKHDETFSYELHGQSPCPYFIHDET